MDGQTNWTDCEKCVNARWSYELIDNGTTKKRRSWFISGCKIKSDPYDCDDYEPKEEP